ncbi:MAG: 1-deoxy-D-xylulose-5-phosphate reductoisomerase [Dehalococcoidales bacterium]|nr:1-deoxy-D-xylulose-5-phosphate reductoisomerase [Dehalococcoidales bacterium]
MEHTVKRLAILGSTGSIGRQTLDVVRALPGYFRVAGLAAGKNAAALAEQAAEFKPDYISMAEGAIPAVDAKVITLEEMAVLPEADIIVIATSGTAGISATLAAVRAGKTIALANKESLVAAGELITTEMAKSGARIFPVDSEHSAIWQCLAGEQSPRRIYLTASGGPFRSYSTGQMAGITVEQALAHPSWTMGPKVTIDSATLLNKGLEVIEARWLFNVGIDDITVLVHPQSIIHSMVEFADGSVKAQLGYPDMRLPIQYALTYPERITNDKLPVLDWQKISGLTFEEPDTERFPCLRLAVEAGRQGGTYPAALCAAGEAAVELFLSHRIGFTDIPRMVEAVLEQHLGTAHPSLDIILETDAWARNVVHGLAREEAR